MPLTAFQAGVARLLSRNRTPDSYLAGGAALHIEPTSKRYSNDLDYFHDSEERVASAFAEDRALLGSEGYAVEVLLNQPGFIRAIVKKAAGETKVEWAHDSSWRFLPTVESELAGFQLHPIDLAINKLLALAGRNEPRDFIDVMEVHRSVLPLGALCWAAAGKDPGFTPPLLLDLLRRRGNLRPEDLNRLRLNHTPDLPTLKREWLAALDAAEHFVASRPPDELGCLYYSPSLGRFVGNPQEVPDACPHHGRPGGVLPRVVPADD
ncbi:MAG: hypothetical protein HYZ29_36040 [Myxococcales bacterium]|nr:hypothetical protein [Myxococcales bacterium]